MYKRCSNAAFAAGICIKDALLYLQQNNDFRINAACTSRFLGRKSIIITVSWCLTCEPYVAILPLSKKKKDRHSESVRPFGWNVNGKDKWYLLFVLYCMQFASVVNNFFVKKKATRQKASGLTNPTVYSKLLHTAARSNLG